MTNIRRLGNRRSGPLLKVDEDSSLVFANKKTRQDASSTLNDTALGVHLRVVAV
jgi:hypothetical protein